MPRALIGRRCAAVCTMPRNSSSSRSNSILWWTLSSIISSSCSINGQKKVRHDVVEASQRPGAIPGWRTVGNSSASGRVIQSCKAGRDPSGKRQTSTTELAAAPRRASTTDLPQWGWRRYLTVSRAPFLQALSPGCREQLQADFRRPIQEVGMQMVKAGRELIAGAEDLLEELAEGRVRSVEDSRDRRRLTQILGARPEQAQDLKYPSSPAMRSSSSASSFARLPPISAFGGMTRLHSGSSR